MMPSRDRVMRIIVRNIAVDAKLGIKPDEQGRTQRLVIHVAVEVRPPKCDSIEATVDYRQIVEQAQALAASGQIGLIETFAQRLGEACLALENARAVEIEVEKPAAIAPALASVRLNLRAPGACHVGVLDDSVDHRICMA